MDFIVDYMHHSQAQDTIVTSGKTYSVPDCKIINDH